MSLDLFYLVILAVLMAFTTKTGAQTSSTGMPTPVPCGQYGFRCVDMKSYQVCLTSTAEDEPPEEIHECREGMVCDEDNPAFCTPIDPLLTTEKSARMVRDSDYAMYDEFSEGNNGNRRQPVDPCECSEETPRTTSTTTEEPPTTTTEIIMAPEFDCEGYGFYPDFTNQTLFWFCDVPQNGEGYFVRHMICGQDRIFDPIHRACVLTGTTRTLLDDQKQKKDVDSSEYRRNRRFSCCNKNPGRYPDESNCRLYHYCLTKEFAPVKELTLVCPRDTAYDPSTNKCSCYATYRCMSRRESESDRNALDDYALQDYPEEMAEVEASAQRESMGGNVNCQTPMRFRDVNDCDGYFLCFGDQVIGLDCPEYYKFDDNLLECLPERIARCQ